LDQTCRWPNKVIPCGQMSRTAMMDLVAQAQVVCTPLGPAGPGVRLARCRAGGFDIGNNMVHTGWALAYRPDTSPYVVTQDKARKARRGLWKGTFALPWVWRRNH
ncbi:MAG: thermonuclease family protein, partial [Rhodospirillales bacterium]